MTFNIPRDGNKKLIKSSKTINAIPVIDQTISVGTTSNTNFASVNSLTLNSTLITSSATQINTVDTTPGIASPSKALVLDSSANISGINSLSCTALIVNGVNITSSMFASSLSDDASNSFMTNVVPGVAQASKTLILNSNNNIKNINKLSTQSINMNNMTITTISNNSKNVNINNLNKTAQTSFLYPNGYYLTIASNNTTVNTYINTSNWSSICWSSKLLLYVAVCSGSIGGSFVADTRRVMTSTNGISWSLQTIPTNSNLNFICWSSKLSIFVAVGAIIVRSSDGINWSTSMSSIPNVLTSICWSEELSMFVAVSSTGTNNNKVLTSSDGINWAIRYTPGDSNLNSICWSPELYIFVAVGGSSTITNNILVSSDGINWNLSNTTLPTRNWKSICWSAEKMIFVAVCGLSSVTESSTMFSNDGYNWVMSKDYIDGSISPTCVCWASDINLFLGIDINSRSCAILYSSNGYAWKVSNNVVATNQYNQIIWNSDYQQFIAVASTYSSTAENPKIAISSPLIISPQNNCIGNSITFNKTNNNIGINSKTPNKLLEINSVNGNCFKHIFNTDNTKFVSYDVTSTGQLNITAQKYFSIASDNDTYGLMLNNTLIKTPASVFNTYLTNNIFGTAQKSKPLVTNSSNNISGINSLSCNSAIVNGTNLSTSSNNQYFQNALQGTSIVSSVLITDKNYNISNINVLGTNKININNSKINVYNSNNIDLKLIQDKVLYPVGLISNGLANSTVRTTANVYTDAAWSPKLGIFIAVGSGTNKMAYSKDGIIWTNITNININTITLNCICWSPELDIFVVFGFISSSVRFLLSKDGINWEISDNLSTLTTTNTNIISICWSPELQLFAAISTSSNLLLSNNGYNWTFVTIPAYNWNTVCWCDTLNLFIASCSNTTVFGKNIIYSNDGIKWTAVTLPYLYGISSIAWSKELNMIVAIPVMSNPNYYPFVYSYDGINWSINYTLNEGAFFGKIQWISDLGVFIAATTSGNFNTAYSTNGKDWKIILFALAQQIKNILWSSELQMIVFISNNSTTATTSIVTSNIINTSNTTTIKSQSNEFICDNINGRIGLGTSTPTYKLQLSTDNAAKPSTSTWTVSSDARLKDNIVDADLNMCYNNIKNLKLKKYTWKNEVYTTEQVSDRSKLGWIAQEVETVFPKAVEKHDMHGYEDCRTLNTDQIIASMYGCAKQIIKNYNNDDEKLTNLCNKIQSLQSFINSLPDE